MLTSALQPELFTNTPDDNLYGLLSDIGEADYTPTEYDVRRALIGIQRCISERERLGRLLEQISDCYLAEQGRMSANEKTLREFVQTYLDTTGLNKITFPDVGQAHLRKIAEKVTVEDRDMAEAVARELGLMKEVLDEAALKKAVLVKCQQGEEIPPGFTYWPERKGLVVR